MYVLPTAIRNVGIMLVFFLATLTTCSGQAVVLVVPLGSPSNPTLADVIVKAVRVELNRHSDITSTEEENGQSPTVPSSDSVGPTTTKADFLLVIDFAEKGNTVDLDMSLRTAGSATTVATYSSSVSFDLNLDTAVSASVAGLLAKPGVMSAIAAAAEARGRTKAEAAAAHSPQPSVASERPAEQPTGAEPPHLTTPPGSGTASTPMPAQEQGRWGFQTDIGVMPLILVGNGSNYFRYGGGGALFAGAHLPFTRLSVSTGLTVGGLALFPATGLSEGMVYSILGGPQLRIGTSPGSAVGVGLLASGGVAVIIAQPAGAASAAKTDLYASGALTAELRLFGRLGIGTELGVLSIFEARYPIIAFQPMLKIGFLP